MYNALYNIFRAYYFGIKYFNSFALIVKVHIPQLIQHEFVIITIIVLILKY